MEQITKYFNTEKNESVLFMLVGIISISFSTCFFIKVKQPFYNGMAYPLVPIALIQIVVGSLFILEARKTL
jgi:hypothetical protein